MPEPPVYLPDPYAVVEGVQSLGEAAARLGVSRSEHEAMIHAGEVEALPTGFNVLKAVSLKVMSPAEAREVFGLKKRRAPVRRKVAKP